MISPESVETFYTISNGRVEGNRVTFDVAWDTGQPWTGRYIGEKVDGAVRGFWLSAGQEYHYASVLLLVPEGVKPPAEEPSLDPFAGVPGVSRVEIVPTDAEVKAGERRRFVARVYNETGKEIADTNIEWYATGRTMTAEGEVLSFAPGERVVYAYVDGALASTTVTVTRPDITDLVVHSDVPSRLAVGSRVPLSFDGMTAIDRWDLDPPVQIVSSDPSVVRVDGTTLVALSTGHAAVTLTADQATERYEIEVAPAVGALSITGVSSDAVRTGDVVHLSTTIPDARPIWTTDEGAEIDPDGAFVAHTPGEHVVVAALGVAAAAATITAEARHAGGKIHIAGHGLNAGQFTSDLWPQNGHVYVGTHQGNQLRTYDVSDPTTPVVTDSQAFDARVVNDIKVSEDGRWLVATREGAADRKNGILVFSLADPAHPQLVSEYTETLTAGVHNVFWHGSLVYAVNNGTEDLHIVDLSDPANPKEIGQWGLPVEGRSLHDVWVQNGIAYLSYQRDGLVILDVGGAGLGGTPTAPVQVSRIFYPGGPTHSAIRHRDYVFVGDEDFSLQGTMASVIRPDARGPVHIIEVSDLSRPKYVGKYEVPEAGAHNFWVQDDRLYIGYYQGGIRVVDVSGELRGNLYRQGRELAYFKPAAGPEEAKLPHSTRVWGVFPMFGDGWVPRGEMFYATDYNSGLWTFTVEIPEDEKPIS